MKLLITSIVLLTASQSLAAEANSIKIGYTGALTGPTSTQGLAVLHATQAYFKKVNQAGGVNGHQLELIAYDDGYEPKPALENTKKLIKEDKVFSLISIYGGPTNAVVVPFAEQEKVPLIGPITAANISEPLKKEIFVIRPSALQEVGILVDQLVDHMGVKEIGMLYQDDAYGNAGLTGLHLALERHGLRVTVAAAYKRNSDEVDTALETIMAKKPQAVIMVALPPAAAAFVKKSLAKDFKPVFLGITSVAAQGFLNGTKGLKFEYIGSMVLPSHEDPKVEIAKSYIADMKASGFSDLHHAGFESYVTAHIFVEGLKRAGQNPSREKFKAALETMSPYDLGGIKVSFSASKHQGITTPLLIKIENGQITPLQP